MKFIVLSLFAVLLTSEAFAQRRTSSGGGVGPRYNPPGGRPSTYDTRPTPSRPSTSYNSGYNNYNDYYNDYRPGYSSRPVIVGPRYNPPGSRRVIRTVRREPVIWSSGFGYQCNMYGQLTVNGRYVHDFYYSSDCSQALSDIRYYGDFCDGEDLYDQTGYLEAQFTYSSECRQALGWFY